MATEIPAIRTAYLRVVSERPDIRALSREELDALVHDLGEKPYRARQLWDWLWRKGAHSWEEMTDLPKAFRERLAGVALLLPITLAEEQRSEDGTVKCALSALMSEVRKIGANPV